MDELYALPARGMAERLARREVTSVDLVESVLARIDAVEPIVHAFTHVFREGARAEARERDAERARGHVRGELHGVPVSVKESIAMAGYPSTLGVIARAHTNSTHDAVIVEMLREQGAIVVGRTNVAQLLLSFENDNPLYGRTVNPFATTHAPGGSSGGEAAAVASGMSPLGFGTDIGGSIRIPAHFSGVCGFKPTLDRWSNRGLVGSMPGQEAIRSQLGPLGRTVGDLALAWRTIPIDAMAARDGRVPPLAAGDPAMLDLKGVRVGYYTDDGVIPASRALVRAVNRAADAMRARGAELVPFTPPGIVESMGAYFGVLGADGAKTAAAMVGDGPVEPGLASLFRASNLPAPVRRAAVRVARAAGQPRLALLLGALGAKHVSEFWKLITMLRNTRFAIEDAMRAERIELLLAPPFAVPAVPHTLSREFALAASYTMLWNLAPLPAGVVPVTTVRNDETTRDGATDLVAKRAAAVDAKSAGLPVGVQVIGRSWEDHRVLGAMAALEAEVANDDGVPRTPVTPR